MAELPEFGGRENIAQFAWYGLAGGIHNVEGFTIYPCGQDAYGNDVIEAHTKDFRANIVVSLIDVWVMHDTARKVAPALWLPWLPIDHEPVPQRVLECLQGAFRPLTYSKWGHDLLANAGIENTYIPHGIEPHIYNVNPNRDAVLQFKREMLRCNGHLTLMVAANKGYPDRKFFQGQLRAWAEFAKDKPDARLYIHTEPTPLYGGLNMATLTQAIGIQDKVLFPDRYQYYKGIPSEFLAFIYNSADVLLSASMSEGFGIPIIEAQACGVPVVVTDFSAMPELVRWGVGVPPADRIWTPMDSWQAWPDVRGITDALEALYAEWHDNGGALPEDKRIQTQNAIHEEFSWDRIVADQWAPLVAEIAQFAPPLTPTRPMVKPVSKPIAPAIATNGKMRIVSPKVEEVA